MAAFLLAQDLMVVIWGRRGKKEWMNGMSEQTITIYKNLMIKNVLAQSSLFQRGKMWWKRYYVLHIVSMFHFRVIVGIIPIWKIVLLLWCIPLSIVFLLWVQHNTSWQKSEHLLPSKQDYPNHDSEWNWKWDIFLEYCCTKSVMKPAAYLPIIFNPFP